MAKHDEYERLLRTSKVLGIIIQVSFAVAIASVVVLTYFYFVSQGVL